MNKKNYILNNANTRYFDYFFFKKLAGTQPAPTPAVEGEGTNFTLEPTSNKKFAEIKCKGNTTQTGTPTPSTPQDINVVSGTQSVTITKGANVQNYTLALGTLELCKIESYQDYIYKSGDDWYVHKAVDKYKITGEENWAMPNTGTYPHLFQLSVKGILNIASTYTSELVTTPAYCKYLLFRSSTDVRGNEGFALYAPNNPYLRLNNSNLTTTAGLQSWATDNDVILYYALATPTDTKITDATLIANLNKILTDGYLKKGTNTISVTSTGTNLPSIIYIKSN